MKNLTRVLALVLTFAMMISTVAFAATFSDIEAGSTYAEATAVLADLGIIKGYEDGTFGADKVITRAEVVAVVNRLQGLSDAAKAAGGATQYTDVPSTEWFAGDVNLATQMGIVSGDGNGLFRPNDQVKYEEAVKMVVAALGYNNEYVMKRGGWPTGYLVIATEAGISKGVTAGAGEPAYRGIVAKLAYNALTAPTFAFNSYSTDGKAIYTVNEEKVTLEEKLQVTKLTGKVVANAITAEAPAAKTENDEVAFKVTDNTVGKAAKTFAKNNTYTFVTATDVAGTFGFTADIYVKENADNEYEVISYVVSEGKNKTVTIADPSTIQSTTALTYASDFASAQKFISVYDDETDIMNTTYDIADAARLIVNGQDAGTVVANATNNMFDLTGLATAELGLIWAPAYGEVTLLDNGNDGVYDYVFVTSYVVSVVDEVIDTATSKKIYAKDGVIDLLKHIENEKGYAYALTLDGAEATIADLEENDVIAVAMSKDKSSYDIMATRATAAGMVTELDKTGARTEWVFTIDGTEYKIANLPAKTNAGMDAVNAGDELTVYVDAFGNIALADKTSTTAKNYGFIVGVGKETSVGDETYLVRLLNKEGEIVTYELAENVRFADADTNGAISGTTVAATVYTKISALNTMGWVINAANATVPQIRNYADRVVTYRANSEGKLTEIVLGSARVNGKESFLTFNDADAVKTAQYNGKTQTFIGKAAVTEDTVVFNLPITTSATRDDFEITTIASLAHEETYDVAFLAVDDENVAGAIIVVNNDATVASGSNLAVATKIMAAQNADYESIYNVTFLQNGEAKTLATTADVAGYIATKMAAGVVFEYSVDDEGVINAVALGTNKDAAWNGNVAAVNNYGSAFNFAGGKEQYVFGVVYAKTNSRVLAIGAAQDTHAVSADANFYLVDLTKAKNNVSVSSFAEIRKFNALGGTDYDYAVFMKYFNDEITDVVIYKGYTTGGYDAL